MDFRLALAGLLIGLWLAVLILTPSTRYELRESNLKISNIEDIVLKGVNVKVVFKNVDGIFYPKSFRAKREGGKIHIEGTYGTIVVGSLRSLELKGVNFSIEGKGTLEELIFDGVELRMKGNFKIRSLVIEGVRFAAEDLRIEGAEKIVVNSAMAEGRIFLKLSKVCEISIKDKNLKISTNRKDLIKFVGGE